MSEIKIDVRKNRMYLTLTAWKRADMPAYVRKIESACRKLNPGFTCLTVFRKKGKLSRKDNDLFINTTGLISAYGASQVVIIYKDTGSRNNSIAEIPHGHKAFIPVQRALNKEQGENILDGKTINRPSL
jgi:hypothetical protein